MLTLLRVGLRDRRLRHVGQRARQNALKLGIEVLHELVVVLLADKLAADQSINPLQNKTNILKQINE